MPDPAPPAAAPPTPSALEQEAAAPVSLASPTDVAHLTRLVNLKIKKLEAQKRERQEAEAERALVPLAEVQRAWGAQVQVLHARFRALPHLLAQRVVGQPYDAVRDLLEAELHGTLEAIARDGLPL